MLLVHSTPLLDVQKDCPGQWECILERSIRDSVEMRVDLPISTPTRRELLPYVMTNPRVYDYIRGCQFLMAATLP
jgi:hypothetical protein